ncbi:hypothetical protein [Salicibibacter kimchii]|uniref:hypothetical protein n=1 Tax=Salicibibacter kimchii TaxID=2099786 RepID=UPI001D04E390|nr:hypothetical protein [Salicibibacter kimchii]
MLSFSVGIAVSYVFVYVLPSLHEEQQELGEQAEEFVMESELYFFGLIGLLTFYSIKKAEEVSQRKYENREGGGAVFLGANRIFRRV